MGDLTLAAVREAMLTARDGLQARLAVLQGYRHQEKGDVPARIVGAMAQVAKMITLLDKAISAIDAEPDSEPALFGPIIGAAVMMLRSLDGKDVEDNDGLPE
jgi:hypothetical protein